LRLSPAHHILRTWSSTKKRTFPLIDKMFVLPYYCWIFQLFIRRVSNMLLILQIFQISFFPNHQSLRISSHFITNYQIILILTPSISCCAFNLLQTKFLRALEHFVISNLAVRCTSRRCLDNIIIRSASEIGSHIFVNLGIIVLVIYMTLEQRLCFFNGLS
jgi:hypothetical protein